MVTHLRNQAYVFSLVLRSHRRRAECQHNIMSSPSKKQHQKATSRSSIKPTFTLQFLTRRYGTSWGLFGKSVVLYPPSRVTGSVVKNEAMLPPLSSLASASVHVLLLTLVVSTSTPCLIEHTTQSSSRQQQMATMAHRPIT